MNWKNRIVLPEFPTKGMKLTVRLDLKSQEYYGNDTATDEMVELAGKTITVKDEVYNGRFHIKEMGWNWTPEMTVEYTRGK